jgi:hypothetical protein
MLPASTPAAWASLPGYAGQIEVAGDDWNLGRLGEFRPSDKQRDITERGVIVM